MRKLTAPAVAAALAFVVPMFTAGEARAGLAACGDIHVEANAQCELTAEGGCDVQCEKFEMTAACDAKIYGGCKVEGCNATAEAS